MTWGPAVDQTASNLPALTWPDEVATFTQDVLDALAAQIGPTAVQSALLVSIGQECPTPSRVTLDWTGCSVPGMVNAAGTELEFLVDVTVTLQVVLVLTSIDDDTQNMRVDIETNGGTAVPIAVGPHIPIVGGDGLCIAYFASGFDAGTTIELAGQSLVGDGTIGGNLNVWRSLGRFGGET